MKLSQFAAHLATGGLLVLSVAAQAAPNLVVNGDFEATGVGQIGSVVSGSGWTNSTVFNGFSNVTAFNFIVDANADYTGFASENSPPNILVHGPSNGVNNGFTGSSNGGKFLGGNGGYATGSVSQTINGLTVGHDYTLSFEWAGAQFTDAAGGYWLGWDIAFGGDSASVGGPGSSAASKGFLFWQSESFTFTATSASQILSFTATGPTGLSPFSLLDGVSVVDASPPPPPVPEPETFAMMLAGLGVLGAVARRRARSGAQG